MLLYSRWLSTPLQTRNKIAEQFGINRSQPIEVSSNVVRNDGYAIEDVENVLNIKNLQIFLGSKLTDHLELWDKLLSVMTGEIVLPTVSALETLSPKEAEQFKKEHKERMIKKTKAPIKKNAKKTAKK